MPPSDMEHFQINKTEGEKNNLYYYEAIHDHDCKKFQEYIDVEVDSLRKDIVF